MSISEVLDGLIHDLRAEQSMIDALISDLCIEARAMIGAELSRNERADYIDAIRETIGAFRSDMI